MTAAVRAFEVYIPGPGREEYTKVVNTTSAGKAKADFLGDLQEYGYRFAYTDLRCRLVGDPVSDEMFEHVREYRGMPESFKCGTRVRVGGDVGTVVGAGNGGGLFTVLFDNGERLACHPLGIDLETDARPPKSEDRP